MSRESRRKREENRQRFGGIPVARPGAKKPDMYVLGPEDRMDVHSEPGEGLARTTLFLTVDAAITDAELFKMMKTAVDARARGAQIIRASFHGWNEDPRELADIPEVRPLAQRLVDTGFIAVLEYSDYWPEAEGLRDLYGKGTGMALGPGALEVWLLAKGKIRGLRLAFTDADLESFRSDLDRASAACRVITGVAPWPRPTGNQN